MPELDAASARDLDLADAITDFDGFACDGANQKNQNDRNFFRRCCAVVGQGHVGLFRKQCGRVDRSRK